MKKFISVLLAVSMLLTLCACGSKKAGYGVQTVQTLVEQEYALGFRSDDLLYFYVTAAIEQLAYDGAVDSLARQWFGETAVSFPKKNGGLESYVIPQDKTLIIGIDTGSFPLAYEIGGMYWGFDIELATKVCELLGWTLQVQSITKENAYVELSAGNIDVAWGGIVLSEEDVSSDRITQYGPYMKNDIVIAARESSNIWNSLRLNGRALTMPAELEAMDALNTDEKLMKRLGQVTRLAGGTIECFEYLFAGKCDCVLTDTAAILYYNSH